MSTSGNKRCGAPGGCTGLSSFGDLKVQWINAGNINKDKEERLPLGKEERTKTPWLLATEYHPGPLCAGVIKGITYYQMYKCIPSSSNGSHFYSLTLSNLGQFPEIQVFVDQYDDPACSKCTTCGTISTLVTIPSGLLNACSSGVSFSTVLLQNVFPNVETVPPLITGYTTSRYYDNSASCQTSGRAPQIIRAAPKLDSTTYLPLQCASTDSCVAMSVAYPLNGYSRSELITQIPYLPVGSTLCPTYPDLVYLALLAVLIFPLGITTGVCFFKYCRRQDETTQTKLHNNQRQHENTI